MKSQLFIKPLGWRTTTVMIMAALTTSAASIYLSLRYQSAAQNSLPTSPVIEPSSSAVAALGYIEPDGEVLRLSAPVFTEGAPRVEKLLVKQGDKVKSGQVIAILDIRDRLQATLAQSQTQVKIAQARLEQVKAGNKIGNIQAQDAKFQRTKNELEGQIVSQNATISSLQAQLQGERNAQEAAIERIKAELRNAQTDCERYQTLHQDGAVSVQERDRICLQQKTTAEQLKEAQANLNRIVSTLQAQIKEANANLNRTVTTLQRQINEEKSTLDAMVEVRPVDVEIAQSEVQSAIATVQKAQVDLNLAYVRAPREGQIFKIHTWPGEMVGNEGIVELGQTDQMYVTTEVYETDIRQVRIGQPATIKSDGVVGDLQGIVDQIGLQIDKQTVRGTDPSADSDARVVEVKIRLSPQASQKVANLTNLQVSVIIDTSTTPKL